MRDNFSLISWASNLYHIDLVAMYDSCYIIKLSWQNVLYAGELCIPRN